MSEVPIELARAAERRSRLEIATLDAPNRQDLAEIADDENLVGGLEIRESQRRLADVAAVGAAATAKRAGG